MRANLEIQLRPEVNAFELAALLNKNKGLKSYAVTCSSIRVWYHEDKASATEVAILVNQASKAIRTNG